MYAEFGVVVVFPFNGINNLRVFNVAFSSIPTVPSSFFVYLWALAQLARQQEAHSQEWLCYKIFPQDAGLPDTSRGMRQADSTSAGKSRV